MSKLIEQAEKLRKMGEELLSSSGILEVLKKYGKIEFVGSYSVELMMHGDIDIHILRDKAFTKNETLEIFSDLVINPTLKYPHFA